MARYRLIDTAGSELDIVELGDQVPAEEAAIALPDGRLVDVVEIYDGEDGQDGGVAATLVVDL
jgi:hypothetical protein